MDCPVLLGHEIGASAYRVHEQNAFVGTNSIPWILRHCRGSTRAPGLREARLRCLMRASHMSVCLPRPGLAESRSQKNKRVDVNTTDRTHFLSDPLDSAHHHQLHSHLELPPTSASISS